MVDCGYWLQVDKNIGHFTWRTKYVLMLPAKKFAKTVFLYCWQWHVALQHPLQQWLRERATVLRNTHIAYLVPFYMGSVAKYDNSP
jgi:hypothetical protein